MNRTDLSLGKYSPKTKGKGTCIHVLRKPMTAVIMAIPWKSKTRRNTTKYIGEEDRERVDFTLKFDLSFTSRKYTYRGNLPNLARTVKNAPAR